MIVLTGEAFESRAQERNFYFTFLLSKICQQTIIKPDLQTHLNLHPFQHFLFPPLPTQTTPSTIKPTAPSTTTPSRARKMSPVIIIITILLCVIVLAALVLAAPSLAEIYINTQWHIQQKRQEKHRLRERNRETSSRKKKTSSRKNIHLTFEQHAIAQRQYANPHLVHCPLARALYVTCECYPARPFPPAMTPHLPPRNNTQNSPPPFRLSRFPIPTKQPERFPDQPYIWSAAESEARLAKLRKSLGIPVPSISKLVIAKDPWNWTEDHYPEVRAWKARKWQWESVQCSDKPIDVFVETAAPVKAPDIQFHMPTPDTIPAPVQDSAPTSSLGPTQPKSIVRWAGLSISQHLGDF